MEVIQYDIVLVDPERTSGSEMAKTRPCVIISPDEMNRYLNTVVVAPMTTRSRPYPTRIKVRQLQKAGWIVVDQIMTIDRRRIVRDIGKLSPGEIRNLKRVLRETYFE
ncbi:MAG: type II toxin-antitoxin system PemK/MazF family toxin [Bacteroidales bacterium]